VRLRVVTPSNVAVDATGVRYVRAEDPTGAFGIQPRHADFITKLVVSVLTFRDGRGTDRHVAIRGGVLRVRGGEFVEVAAREAVVGEDLGELREVVLGRLREAADLEAKARTRATQLHASVARYLYRYVRAERGGPPQGLAGSPEDKAL
jgi:F-type H+-transporting ATPase subunit epsilon